MKILASSAFVALSLLATPSAAFQDGSTSLAPSGSTAAYAPLTNGSAIQDQNFYLLTVLDQDPQYRQALQASQAIRALAQARASRIRNALSHCNETASCRVLALLWTPQDIAAFENALAAEPGLSDAAVRHLRPSSAFALYEGQSDEALLRTAWKDAAESMNRILRVYGLGEAPRYPQIDAISFEPESRRFQGLVDEAIDVLSVGDDGRAFYADSLRFSLMLLYLNDRETVRVSDVLERRENAAAAAAAQRTDWSKWRYPAILVPGDGPDTPGERLGEIGKLRVMRAAELYHAELAPFLIVSGGAVHPAHTSIIEAEEMKRELMDRYGVPESAIFIEPSARHTTTNFRNAIRLMLRYGLPIDRSYVVTSTRSQISKIADDAFRVRLNTELGYAPIADLRALGPHEVVFQPSAIATHRDARDPLDP